MHRIPACSALLRQCRSSAAVALPTTPTFHHLHSASSTAEYKSRIVLSARERMKLNLILKCPDQQSKLHQLCGERETKYEMSGNGRELLLISRKSDELSTVEKTIRRMLAEIETYQFEISHAARSLLKLDNLIKFNVRSLLDYGQEWVEVEPQGRSENDDYIFTVTGKPEALACFKRKLNTKLNCIRYFEMPLPDFVPIDQELLEVFRNINKQPDTVCFLDDRTVKCWNLDKDPLSSIQERLQAVVDSWRVECETEKSWVGRDDLAKYVQIYLDSEERSPLTQEVEVTALDPLHDYDGNCVTLKLKGLKYPVKKLTSEIERAAREAAFIKLPVPTDVLNSLAASLFRSYWSSYEKEMLVILPHEADPSLTLVGPFDSVNHRLLYFYRVLRANYPDKFDLLKPLIVFKYNAGSQFKYDENGIISDLKLKFPNATFKTNATPNTDSTHPLHLYVAGPLDDLLEIDSVLKAQVPVVIGPSYPDAGKIFNVLQDNGLVSAEVESSSYGGGSSTLLKGSQPRYARQARDRILGLMDRGQRYRTFWFETKGVRNILVSENMVKEIEDFARSIEMPISISTYKLKSTQKTCIFLVEGVGDFGQFLKMRNFCNQKFNFKSYREITLTASDVVLKTQRRWLQNCYEQLLNVFDGPQFLFKRYDTWCIGGREDSLDEASQVIQSALDGLGYKVVDISRIDNHFDISDLGSKWPLVHFWTTKTKTRTNLKMVGKMESVDRIAQELSAPPLPKETLNVPLHQKGFPYLNHLGKKLFPGDEPLPKSWPPFSLPLKIDGSLVNCSMKVNRTPDWSITLEGEAEEVEESRRRLMEVIENVHYREVYLDSEVFEGAPEREATLKRLRDAIFSFGGLKLEDEENKARVTQSSEDRKASLKRLRAALISSNVLQRVVDDTEVSASVGPVKDNIILSVVGDEAERVELAASKIWELSEKLRVEELPLTGKQHLISHKYVSDLMDPEIKLRNESRLFNVGYYIARKDNVITVFGTTDDVKICSDKIGDILLDTVDVTLDVSEEFRGPYIGELIRHNYFKYSYPAARLFYNTNDRSFNIYGPRLEVEQVQKYLEEVTHVTYKIEYHYSNFVTLCRRLKPLATGVLIVEGPDRTVNLVGSKENVRALVRILDFVMGKRKSCYFTLSINDRIERVHLGTVTNLVTKSASTEFPDVRWWLQGDQLRFSGPEIRADRALRYALDKYFKRKEEGDNELLKVVPGGE